MKSALRSIISILTVAVALLGCAGLQANNTPEAIEVLPDMVHESFHFKVQDAAILRYLSTTNPDSLTPDRRLEVILLRELAKVSTEKELPKIFDRLWDRHKEIRNLLRQSDHREEFIHPLVETYYLLSAGKGQKWQAETAECLYKDTLSRLQPAQLSGYALHFYTLALLKNSKFDAAMPYLLRLEHFTSPRIYLKDLTQALGYAMDAGAYQSVCKLMTVICQTGIKYNLGMPDEQLKSAVTALKASGKLDQVRITLAPVVRENPTLQVYSFARLLNESRHTFHEKAPSKLTAVEYPVKETGVDEPQINIPKPHLSNCILKAPRDTATQENRSGPLAENAGRVRSKIRNRCLDNSTEAKGAFSLKTMKVRIEVQVIKAGLRSDHVDPALEEIAEELKHTVNFSSFALVRRKIFHLRIDEKARLPLSRRHTLRVVPRSLTPDICRIEIAVLDNGTELLNTFVESIDGGTTVIGGPQLGDKVLLIRLRTFILKRIASSPKQDLKGVRFKEDIPVSG